MKSKSGISPLLYLSAGLGLLAFVLLMDRIHPFKAAPFAIDRHQAIAVADQYLQTAGFSTEGFRISAMVREPVANFQYLQSQVGLDSAVLIARDQHSSAFSANWFIFYYQNLPASAPQQKFAVDITPQGQVCGFTHIIPAELDSLPPTNAHLTQEQALVMAHQHLARQNIKIDEYEVDNFSSQKFAKRTDHVFRWKKTYPAITGQIKLSVRVQGDRIDEFHKTYEPPEKESMALKASEGYRFFILVAALVLFCIFAVWPVLVFLRKYHEGEISVGRASLLFVGLWSAAVLSALLAIPIQAFGWGLGELSFDWIIIVKLVIYAIIVYPVWGIVLFTGWSVGESLAREKMSHKLEAMDALFNIKLSTLNVSVSLVRGYLYGFTALGGFAILLYAGLIACKGTTNLSGYITTIDLYFPFLAPWLGAVTTALMSEIPFRLFANVAIFKKTGLRSVAVLGSALIFAVTSPAFISMPLTITPIYLEYVLLFSLGIYFGILFWKYDLLTVLCADFVFIGILQVIPVITNPAPYLFWSGVLGTALLFTPVILIVSGFIKKETFAYQPDTMPAHIKRISERERMARELEIARQVQMKLLPKSSPDMAGCDVAGFCLPAEEVGGDYYDFISLGDRKLGVAIGDVSGKGVPAAIYMTLTKGVFQSHAEVDVSPKQVLTKVNGLMYRSIERGSFVSMFYAVIDLGLMKMKFARAGHNPAIYYNRHNQNIRALEPAGIALGLEKGEVFANVIKEQEMNLQSGDLFVMYTDGFSEAMNNDQQQYSEERLHQTIQKHSAASAQQIIHQVYLEIKSFSQEHPQHDDMTMVVVKIF